MLKEDSMLKHKSPARARLALAVSCLLPIPALAAISQQQIAAAEATAAGKSCVAAGSFYWEVGDQSGAAAGGSRGWFVPAASTLIPVASGSKLLFAAYVVQYRGGAANLSPAEVGYLRMQQGYTKGPCVRGLNVLSCFDQLGGSTQTAADIGKFYYSGGQMQALASLGLDQVLRSDTDTELAGAISSGLGLPANTLSYIAPSVSGQAAMSASAYGAFLRRILSGDLLMSQALGADPVCTSTATDSAGAPVCPSAVSAPAAPDNQVWQYSLGHWVEKDPLTGAGDGAYNSIGEFGFYPWIDATRTYYGIVARAWALSPLAYQNAVLCGQAIRKALINGVAQ
jgi:hypothetical protein